MASPGHDEPVHRNHHPSTAAMVCEAIEKLHERGGSSIQAIKKYVVSNYLLDPQRSGTYITKYIKKAVASGELVQTKGHGAVGSFKLAPKSKVKPKVAKVTDSETEEAAAAAAAASKPKASKSAASKPAATKSAASKPAATKSAASKSASSKPAATKSAASKAAAPKAAAPKAVNPKTKATAATKQSKKQPKKESQNDPENEPKKQQKKVAE